MESNVAVFPDDITSSLWWIVDQIYTLYYVEPDPIDPFLEVHALNPSEKHTDDYRLEDLIIENYAIHL